MERSGVLGELGPSEKGEICGDEKERKEKRERREGEREEKEKGKVKGRREKRDRQETEGSSVASSYASACTIKGKKGRER